VWRFLLAILTREAQNLDMRHPRSLLIVGFFLSLCSFSLQAQRSLTNGLVAYFPLNGNALDASGNGHDGSINGATSTNGLTGAADSGFLFTGSRIGTITGTGIQLSNSSLTASFWFKKNYVYIGNHQPGCVVALGSESSKGKILHFSIINGGDAVSFDFFSDALDVPTPGLGSDHWQQIVGTYDLNSHERRVYIDGTAYGTNTSAGFSGTTDFGFWVDDGEVLLDEIRFYNRALSAEEVRLLFNYERAGSGPLIDIAPAVRLTFSLLVPGTIYQLQDSSDLDSWTDYGAPVTPNTTTLSQYVDVLPNRQFWRVKVISP